MKVKCTVLKYEEVEVEIDDKFRKLAVSHPWERDDLTNDDYQAGVKAVEQATGLNFGDADDDGNWIDAPHIVTVTSAENGAIMMEW